MKKFDDKPGRHRCADLHREQPCRASVVVGATLALSVVWAGIMVFGPVSDARTVQMAAAMTAAIRPQ